MHLGSSTAVAALIAAASMPIHAQVMPATGAAAAQANTGITAGDMSTVNEIVVTARKRAESVQDVPIAVTVVSSQMLDRNFITQIDQVTQLTPNVVIQPVSISPTQAAPFIRGIGNRAQEPSQDPAIAISVDGVYLSQIAGSLLDIFDAAQVEVLRGPQGTLQGRNSPGGAINVTTRRPGDEIAGRFEASYGNYDDVQLKAAIESPVVSELLAAKAAVFYSNRDGYVRNYTTGGRQSDIDTIAGRVGLLFTPTQDINWYVTGDYTRDRSGQPGLRYVGVATPRRNQTVPLTCSLFGFCTPDAPRTTGMEFVDGNKVDVYGLTSNFDWSFGDVSLASVTGYRRTRDRQNVDVDGVSINMLNSVDRDLLVKQFSQELRLGSNRATRGGAGNLDWVAGLYYLNSKFDLEENIQVFGLAGGVPNPAPRNQTLNSYAAFGQATYNITDSWSISVGARQSWDRKRLFTHPAGEPAGATFRAKFDNLSVEAGTEYKINSDVLAYFRFSQGYRSGGVNGNAAVLAAVATYDPETVDAYEVGLKSIWFDRRLTANVSAFTYNYKELQRDVVIALPTAPFFAQQVQNRGEARIRGLEAELALRPSENLSVNASFGYLDAENREAAYRHLRIPYTPKYTVGAGFDWSIPQGNNRFIISGDVNMKSRYNVNPEDIEIGDQESFVVTNASVGYNFAEDRFTITGYVRNLFDTYYITAAEPTGGLTNWVVEGAPRTYGVRLQARF